MHELLVKIRYKLRRFGLKNLFLAIKVALSNKYLLVVWYKREKGNFGDDLNPYILEKLTTKKVVNVIDIWNFRNKKVYSFIGSIIESTNRRNLIIIGSGFMYEDSVIKHPPIEIYSVRGPLSKKTYEKNNVNCPNNFGDPALLLPLIYKPKNMEKKYEIGIIPHYVDSKSEFIMKLNLNLPSEILIIDIEKGVEEVIDEILSCEKIISSSLHGLITADAYNIPARWVQISSMVRGNGFKFNDYFLSINENKQKPFLIDAKMSIDDLYSLFDDKRIVKIDFEDILKNLPKEFKI